MEPHPLSVALSSPIPVSPSFIYLHHPFHSSGYALPANFANVGSSGPGRNGKGSLDRGHNTREGDDLGRVVIAVDVAALAGGSNVPNSFSQKAFYNRVIRELFASIMAKLSLLEDRRPRRKGEHSVASIERSPQTSKRSKKKASTTVVDPFEAASTAFIDKFAPISRKDVYRWDVFLVRVRSMMDAFSSAVSISRRQDPPICTDTEDLETSLTLVILEGHLLQKCLGVTWHAILRLSEMVEIFTTTLVLCSTHAWDDVRPMTGDAPEPYHLFLRAPNKNETLLALSKYNSHPLFPYFLDLLYTACCHLIPLDLIPESERLAKTLWQIYMLPLDGFHHQEETSVNCWNGQPLEDTPSMNSSVDTEPLRITYQLLTDLKNQSAYAFASANECLIPNRISASRFLDVFTGERKRKRRELEEEATKAVEGGEGTAWFALANQVRQEQQHQQGQGMANVDPIIAKLSAMPATKPPIPRPAFPRLPLYAKYLILAAYCASYNSPRTDLRMFGRGPLTLRGKTRRSGLDGAGSAGRGYEGSGSAGKKAGAGLKKSKTLGKVGKVPQGLLGPKSFPLERMLAIFQSLLAEHGFRQDAYNSDDFSDSDSDSESSGSRSDHGDHSDIMDTREDEAPDSPSRHRNGKRKASGRDSKGMLDFSVFDEETRRIERKRRRENDMLRSWEEEVEEISRSVGLFALIRELEGIRLLNRISPKDRLDNILLRCEAPKEMVLDFARQVKVDLTTYLVEGE